MICVKVVCARRVAGPHLHEHAVSALRCCAGRRTQLRPHILQTVMLHEHPSLSPGRVATYSFTRASSHMGRTALWEDIGSSPAKQGFDEMTAHLRGVPKADGLGPGAEVEAFVHPSLNRLATKAAAGRWRRRS